MLPAAGIRHPEVRALAERARSYVEGFSWCVEVTGCALAFAVAGVLGVFRIDLEPAGAGVDPTVWVVVGDLPPAYLAFEEGDGWQDALRGYVAEMQAWVDAVRAGDSLADVVPVAAAPTSLHADVLARRLTFIRHRLIDVDPASLAGDD